jgi:hypothetical protein
MKIQWPKNEIQDPMIKKEWVTSDTSELRFRLGTVRKILS